MKPDIRVDIGYKKGRISGTTLNLFSYNIAFVFHETYFFLQIIFNSSLPVIFCINIS